MLSLRICVLSTLNLVQLIVGNRRAQVATLQLAIMNHKLILLDDEDDVWQDEGGGQKCPESVHDYPQFGPT